MTAGRRDNSERFDPKNPRLVWDGPVPEPQVRMAGDLNGIYANDGCKASGPLYYMFRDLARSPADRWWLKKNGLRYDITVIPPRTICREFVKTKGHYHTANAAGHGYPEVYEVLGGTAHYLLQRQDLTDAVMVEAHAGDVVVVPPGYGHVTINPSAERTLHMANIVSSRFSSIYREYETGKGAAWYELDDCSFIKNRAYQKVPALRKVAARRIATARAGLAFPLYNLVAQRRGVLRFLNHPEEFPAFEDLVYP